MTTQTTTATGLRATTTDLARRTAVELQVRHLTLRDRLRARGDSGQGTVEYVALILLVGAILSAVVASGVGHDFKIGKTIGDKLNDTVNTVGTKGKGN